MLYEVITQPTGRKRTGKGLRSCFQLLGSKQNAYEGLVNEGSESGREYPIDPGLRYPHVRGDLGTRKPDEIEGDDEHAGEENEGQYLLNKEKPRFRFSPEQFLQNADVDVRSALGDHRGADHDRPHAGEAGELVITSYSIHYTKLYEKMS